MEKRVTEIEAHEVKRDIILDATFATGNESNPIPSVNMGSIRLWFVTLEN